MSLYLRGRIFWYEFEANKKRYVGTTRQTDREAALRVQHVVRSKVNGLDVAQDSVIPLVLKGSDVLTALLIAIRDECRSDRKLSPSEAMRIFPDLGL